MLWNSFEFVAFTYKEPRFKSRFDHISERKLKFILGKNPVEEIAFQIFARFDHNGAVSQRLGLDLKNKFYLKPFPKDEYKLNNASFG